MEGLTRREMLEPTTAIGGWMALGIDLATTLTPAATATWVDPYKLPPLSYHYAALETHIDAQTMKLHHEFTPGHVAS